ncbi:SNF2-related protein [Saccharopolyspora phatthalungensis]|uniref:Superfamily II DNA or RNA helicase n=1 Tax=Saccharopolyspora phatthalungensis TaxID=664693 RepID=A0A840Q724_9PSEU|nr:SNF2-related protein [Saccharopolyspora phatthalungensis]MBB5154205.1 superfamily II DNA or RNA helicase [Saccharopolyspora phatthalungensis]
MADEQVDGFAPGTIVEVRDEAWIVRSAERLKNSAWAVSCTGVSELVRDTDATFLTDLDQLRPLVPEKAEVVPDDSPQFRRTRLWLEAVLRKTAVPLHDERLIVSHRMLLDELGYQRRAVAQALSRTNLRTRILIADAVGLGKTLEIGMLLAELARRGRAERILVVTPRHVLEQMQHELWTRFAIPLVRLDSDGIKRVRQELPASRNPFTYYRKVIVSVDTLKSGQYRAHLEKHHWDAVVIDESHNLTNTGTLNNELARVLAPRTDALVLASATPHNGKPESFAELVSLLDATAISDRSDYQVEDIAHLFVRRHRHSADVADEVGKDWAERPEPKVLAIPANSAEEKIINELTDSWLYPEPGRSPLEGTNNTLFPWTLAKAALSSTAALRETIANRRQSKKRTEAELSSLDTLGKLAAEAQATGESKLTELVGYLGKIGVGSKSETRVVLFSERLATLRWLLQELPNALRMPVEAFAMLHGGLPDDKQQAVVEQFKLADSPVRVLVAGDVASEGVNLHAHCHNLVHVDIPWSLIRIEQRNGRIDRYGQKYPPQITALALTSTNDRFTGDVRVLTKLLDKEHAAHQALGDAATLLNLHSVTKEEQAVAEALAKGRDIEEVVPDLSDDVDEWDFFHQLMAQGDQRAPDDVEVDDGHNLFRTDLDFLREALREVYPNPAEPVGRGGVAWEESDDGSWVRLTPPPDLKRRFRALPQSYRTERKVTERLVLATDKPSAEDSLKRARDHKESGTLWPEAHFLGPLHPVLDWACDRALARFERNQVPLVVGDVELPTVLVQGTLTNARGQVVSCTNWAFGFVDDDPRSGPIGSSDALEILEDAGIRDGGINAGYDLDPSDWQWLVPKGVAAMRAHLQRILVEQGRQLAAPVWEAEARLERWEADSRRIAEGRDAGPRTRMLKQIDAVVRGAKTSLESLRAVGKPGVRVLAVIAPRQDVQEGVR